MGDVIEPTRLVVAVREPNQGAVDWEFRGFNWVHAGRRGLYIGPCLGHPGGVFINWRVIDWMKPGDRNTLEYVLQSENIAEPAWPPAG